MILTHAAVVVGVAPEAWALVLLMGSPVILVGGLLTAGVVALVERRVRRSNGDSR